MPGFVRLSEADVSLIKRALNAYAKTTEFTESARADDLSDELSNAMSGWRRDRRLLLDTLRAGDRAEDEHRRGEDHREQEWFEAEQC